MDRHATRVANSSRGRQGASRRLRLAGSGALLLGAVLLSASAQARVETLRWSHPTPSQVDHFRIHVGSQSGSYDRTVHAGKPTPDASGVFSHTIEVSDGMTVYVAVSASDGNGVTSPLSNERVRAPAEDPGSEPSDPEPAPSDPPDEAWAPEGAVLAQDFQTSSLGTAVPRWRDSRPGNSMQEDDALFEVVASGGNRYLTTSSSAPNIHSHYVGSGSGDWSGYEVQGRMRVASADASIGVTAHSQYASRDAYYRLARFETGAFEINWHPLGADAGRACSAKSTGVVPQAGRWYRFRLQVTPSAGAMRLRAKVWPDGAPETSWQASCTDQGSLQLARGTFGVWSFDGAGNAWDELAVVPLAAQPAPPADPELGPPGQPVLLFK